MKQKAKLQMTVNFDRTINNLADLKQLVKDMELAPHQIFDSYSLMKDEAVQYQIKREVEYELTKKKEQKEEAGSSDHLGDMGVPSPSDEGEGDKSQDDEDAYSPASHIPD